METIEKPILYDYIMASKHQENSEQRNGYWKRTKVANKEEWYTDESGNREIRSVPSYVTLMFGINIPAERLKFWSKVYENKEEMIDVIMAYAEIVFKRIINDLEEECKLPIHRMRIGNFDNHRNNWRHSLEKQSLDYLSGSNLEINFVMHIT